MIAVPIEFDDGEKRVLPIFAAFDDSQGKDVLNIFINSKFGLLSGTYDPETMAETLWGYFKKFFPTDEPFPKDAPRLKDNPDGWQDYSTARKLFEYAYEILADHILEILEDSLKLACHEVLTRVLTDGEYLTHTLPEVEARKIREMSINTALSQAKKRIGSPSPGPNPVIENRRFIYECNQALRRMADKGTRLSLAELAHQLNLDVSTVKRRFRENGFDWKGYKARFKKRGN